MGLSVGYSVDSETTTVSSNIMAPLYSTRLKKCMAIYLMVDANKMPGIGKIEYKVAKIGNAGPKVKDFKSNA